MAGPLLQIKILQLLQMEHYQELPYFVIVSLQWFKTQPVIFGLLCFMAMDWVSGVCLAIVKKTLSSTVSWRGASKKALVLLVIGMSIILQNLIPDFVPLPLANIVALFYTYTEAISILENVAAAGVPLPSGLVDTLIKLKEQQRIIELQRRTPPQQPLDPSKPQT